MRILHTADWHLGRRLNRASRLAEQRELLADLVEHTDRRDPDVVVVAGDVYDVFTPGADAERLYYRTVQRLADDGTRPVLVVAGNHDSPARLTAPRALLEDLGVFVYGDPHDPDDVPQARDHEGFTIHDAGPGWLDVETDGGRGTFHLLSFPSRSRLPSDVDEEDASATEIVDTLSDRVPTGPGARYLVGHLYVGEGHDVAEDTDDYVGGAYAVHPDALETYDAAFLGHLHRPFGSGNWRYAGAPMAFDFDDPATERGAWLYEDGVGETVPLAGDRGLTEHRLASFEEALALAEDDEDGWVRLVFERGTVIERNQRKRLREAFGDRLVNIRFTEPDDDALATSTTVELGDLDPEQAFRDYVEDREGKGPDDELVEMFLEVLDGPQTPDDEPEAETGQATLEVDG
jgi:exonuclease SbcD